MKYINLSRENLFNKKNFIHLYILMLLIVVLWLGFHCGFVNRNHNVVEPFYGYGSASAKIHFKTENFLDFSTSENPQAHPYIYIHNPDLSYFANLVLKSFGAGENSYKILAALTAVARVLALYFFFLFMFDRFKSVLLSMLVVMFISTDYYNYILPSFNILRGSALSVFGMMLFSVNRLAKSKHCEYKNIYFYITIISLYLSLLIGVTSLYTFAMCIILFSVTRVMRLSFRQVTLLLFFGVFIPFLYYNINIICSLGVQAWYLDKALTSATKLSVFKRNPLVTTSLFNAFGDAYRIVMWPDSVKNSSIKDLFTIVFGNLKIYYNFGSLILDNGIKCLVIIFLLFGFLYSFFSNKILRGWHSKSWLHYTRHLLLLFGKNFKFYFLFLTTIVLTVILGLFLFPSYYLYVENGYNPYLALIVVSLVCTYTVFVLIQFTKQCRPQSNIIKIIVVLFIGFVVYERYSINKQYLHFFPVEKENIIEVVSKYRGKLATSNTNMNFAYSQFLNAPCIFTQWEGMSSGFTDPYTKFNPIPIGSSWSCCNRDQFNEERYNFPQIHIFRFNKYDIFFNEVFFVKRNYKAINEFDFEVEIGKQKKRVKSLFGVDRVLYEDGYNIIIDSVEAPPYRKEIWDVLMKIKRECLDSIINENYRPEDFRYLLQSINERLTDVNIPVDKQDIFYSRAFDVFKHAAENIFQPIPVQDLPKESDLYTKSLVYSALYEEAGIYIKNVYNAASLPAGFNVIMMMLISQYLSYESNGRIFPELFDILFRSWYQYLPLQLKQTALTLKYVDLKIQPTRDVRALMVYADLVKKMRNP